MSSGILACELPYKLLEQSKIPTLDLQGNPFRRITKEIYDKKLEELKDQQYRLGIELEEHTKADHQYHIHVATVLNLCRRIRAIFDDPRSEVSEKRAILNFILQNPTVDGKKLVFTMRKPFDVVLELAECPTWLRDQDSNLEPSP